MRPAGVKNSILFKKTEDLTIDFCSPIAGDYWINLVV